MRAAGSKLQRHESWFCWHASAAIFAALVVYAVMPETKDAMER
jgi:hypothetical protein